MTEKELDWNRMFALDLPAVRPAKSKRCSCGGSNCKTAKGFVCKCSCHHLNHGLEQRTNMPTLEKMLGLDGLTVTVTKTGADPLGDLALSRELSGLAEVEGEI